MKHGVEGFFAERARNTERVSKASVAVSLVMLGVLWIPQLLLLTPFANTIRPYMRIGFAGPERVVRTVQLTQEPGPIGSLRNVGPVRSVPAQGGSGGSPEPEPNATRAPGRGNRRLPGLAEGPMSLMQRALASEGRTPIFQSEELVIEQLVKPIYPEEARSRGAEGKVAVIALVDTVGRVVEVEVMSGSGEFALDRAATDAVSLCRFRPFRIEGKAQEVYAVFRFAFRIY